MWIAVLYGQIGEKVNKAIEKWVPIEGFESLYEISNFGRVKSLCAGRWRNSIIIRKAVPDKDGYLTVCLKKDGKTYCKKIHRLVAIAFIDNPSSLPQINHIDENRKNNFVENLEWCDCKYNNNYNSKPTKHFKPICKLAEDGTVIKVYESVNAAAKDNNIEPSLISPVLKGKRKHAGGFRWEYQY